MPFRLLVFLAGVLGCLLVQPVQADIEIHRFDSPEQEALYNRLVRELRCLVCQNQNLADSHADLARDLREEIYEMVQAGKSRAEIVDFMVQRYGDFVLYRPPVKPKTLPLWLGPFLLLVLAIVVFIVVVRRRSRPLEEEEPVLDEAARQKARQLLGESEQENP